MNILKNHAPAALTRHGLSLLLMLVISGCATTADKTAQRLDNKTTFSNPSYRVAGSYLAGPAETAAAEKKPVVQKQGDVQLTEKTATAGVQNLLPLPRSATSLRTGKFLSDAFSDKASLTIAVDQMPMRDFLHYTFGELLNINYIIDEKLKQDEQTVTLNIREAISPRRLMQLTSDLLTSRGVQITYDNDLYFIHKAEKRKKGQNVATAVGRELSDVPQTSQDILQIVPLKYGVKISIERALRQLVGVQISQDADQSALFLQGKREEILRSLEFIHLLDAPANRGRFISLIPLTYIDSKAFTAQVSTLLGNEGIPIATNNAQGKNIVMVPIEQISAIAVFAAEKSMLQRVRYWAKIIDKPEQSVSKQYFIYHPQFARASDLGDSLSALLGGTSAANSRSSSSKSKTGSAPSAKRSAGVSSDKITLVVDDRANAIIVYTSGNDYQALLPLIKKLDVLPRQVMLDITIAEVRLKDEFNYGVEWALTKGALSKDLSSGSSISSNLGKAIGSVLNLQGPNGTLQATFAGSNSLVNVLSNPTLLVRDGVTANIVVGDEISVIGSTSTDVGGDGRETTTVEYRKTGLDVQVTPSINAQGIVIMEINQKITNSTPLADGQSGNPDISERSIKTEVVAQNGQTVMLAGLVSETKNDNESKTPWLADIPLLGYLFKNGGDSISRTELVMLITPKVINRTDQWNELTNEFQDKLQYLKLGGEKQ